MPSTVVISLWLSALGVGASTHAVDMGPLDDRRFLRVRFGLSVFEGKPGHRLLPHLTV